MAETVHFFDNRLNDIFCRLTGIFPDNVFKTFFAEHFSLRVLGFPDTVGAHHDNLTRYNPLVQFLICCRLGNSQGQGIAGELFEPVAFAVVDHGRIMPGVDPVNDLFAAVDLTDKQRHETPGIFDITG